MFSLNSIYVHTASHNEFELSKISIFKLIEYLNKDKHSNHSLNSILINKTVGVVMGLNLCEIK